MGYPLTLNVIRNESLINPETGGKYGKHARGSRAHNGWDLKAKFGTSVYAVGPGKITLVRDKVPGYGTVVQSKFLRGSKHFFALYAHLSHVTVKLGQQVAEGCLLGSTGNTGNARGQPPHLHFEIATDASLKKGRVNQIDPAVILGDFLRDSPSGSSYVLEESYPSPQLSIGDIEYAQKVERTV